MYKIAVIGDRDSVYGFSDLELETCIVNSAEEAREQLYRLENENCAIIYITEQLAEELSEELERFLDMPYPAVIPIPGVTQNTGIGNKKLSEWVIKAVGSEI